MGDKLRKLLIWLAIAWIVLCFIIYYAQYSYLINAFFENYGKRYFPGLVDVLRGFL